MSLRLDNYVKRKEITKLNKLDKRKYRANKSIQDILLDNMRQELDFLGVVNKSSIISELIKIKNYNHLNFRLLILVYLYFSEKNFDLGNVVLDFDNDFKEIIKDIKKRDLFDLEKRNVLFSFRQDFIIYLMLIDNIDTEEDENEEELDVNQLEEENLIEREENINYEKYENMRDEYEYQQEENIDDEYFTY